jgi:antitoxin (DNA-binding transcriptional repressor) of toxin-antitoxin stability system
MKTVTVDEARENLPDLLRLVGSGKRVVITDGGKWVAALTPPPDPPPTPEELAAARARAEAAIKAMVRQRIEDGYPLPADSPLRELFEAGELPQ